MSAQMRAYYDRRAGEYDDWWLGRGLFAARERPGWDGEVAQLRAAISALPAVRRVLDVGCGTGWLTRELRGEAIVGLDQSAAMLTVAAQRLPHATLVRGDALAPPFEPGSFDRVFASHFYGHLLGSERAAWLAAARALAKQLVVCDSAWHEGVEREQWQERMLDDGSRHSVYKRFFDGEQLAAELGGGELLHAGRWFVLVRA